MNSYNVEIVLLDIDHLQTRFGTDELRILGMTFLNRSDIEETTRRIEANHHQGRTKTLV
jgi:hypothetical protein